VTEAAQTGGLLRWQRATIVEVRTQTPRVKSIFLKPTTPFRHFAGQHVDVRLTAPDGYQAQRSYSIASAPETTETIELAIERLRDGEVSPFFHEIAEAGDEIEIRGPIGGHFIWTTAEGGPALLIAGGSGVVPLVSMIRHHAAQASPSPMLLLYSARTRAEILFRDELLSLDRQDGSFQLIFALTRDGTDRQTDHARRIDAGIIVDALNRLPAPPRQVFVCGSNAFVAAAADLLVETAIPPESIRTERYGG